MLNWNLLGNPYNWVIVFIMWVIAAFLFHLLAQMYEAPIQTRG